ncbi:two component system histidine kinase [Renibacterium salmoninarum ATCC 33209]|uniref:histidine kinase n=1 Tax=Renibacterium salmoninarum (strain ATCC 33209 / DSM 20767 / JCM 11484 / NBRC 15589 / NCIMB 2235) TaxID=288705 RepID=A9WLI8_RENSM|nr:HAMP domain-containing sensor histidine kinase [Renibacterium salmoninarum]ABY21948.1 two component system histidine kinase [Renibacterium salmoninarum ATCC 33209]
MSELTESESRARRFVADVSHELRTPLAAMVASAEVLENPAASRADAREAARLTSSSARRLAKLTDDLLEISRFDAGHASVQVAPFDATARFLDLTAARHWPETVTLKATEPLQIMTDPRRWDVIVGNLVANALKHGSAPVVVDARIVNDIFQLEVQDAGPGIPAEDQLHIFDRFFKADSSRSADGTGLGLALVAENCALLGGNITVQSTPGATVFIVELPVRSRTDSQL